MCIYIIYINISKIKRREEKYPSELQEPKMYPSGSIQTQLIIVELDLEFYTLIYYLKKYCREGTNDCTKISYIIFIYCISTSNK